VKVEKFGKTRKGKTRQTTGRRIRAQTEAIKKEREEKGGGMLPCCKPMKPILPNKELKGVMGQQPRGEGGG